jgi:hypothetical protein
MGYQNKARPDYFEMREDFRLSGIDKSDKEIREEYREWLLADASADLTDLIEDIRLGKSKEDLIENIRFIKATLLEYRREVYPASPDEDSDD